MTLGFYYHIPVNVASGGINVPSYIGFFIDGLATRVKTLVLIAHKTSIRGDYILQAKNIVLVDLGVKSNSLHRSLCYRKILAPVDRYISQIDVLLVRAPSPLAPTFSSYKIPVVYYLVGDYAESAALLKGYSMKIVLQKIYLRWCHHQLLHAVRQKKVIVNSYALMKKFESRASSVKFIPSTTLRAADFCSHIGKSKMDEVKILYTGRLDLNKGLLELIDATYVLLKRHDIQLHLVGWEEDSNKPVEVILKKHIARLKLDGYVYFHGKKSLGDELNSMYRMADIYCIPSYHEGFPRTIWEAMANGLPVVASRVGGIPYILENDKDSILIEPKNSNAVVLAIEKLLTDNDLRNRIRVNGWRKAKTNTVDKRSVELIEYLNETI